MFEKVSRDLNGLEIIQVPISADKEGYYDKECPSSSCHFQFKVYKEDWKNIFRDEVVYCPMCRHEAEADEWLTSLQIQEAKDQAIKLIQGRFGRALEAGAREFNSSQAKNSLFKMSISVSGTRPNHYTLLVGAQQEMNLKIKCRECNSRYSVIGSAFFCPSCGHNSAEETFDNSLNKVAVKLKNLPTIRKTIEAINKDEAETTCRSLIETSLDECVVAFQRFCEVTFRKLNPLVKVRFNAFQKLDVGGKYWKELYGESYSDWLTKSEFSKLNELFQKRHLLSHTEGMVDQKYIDRSGDTIYSVGQRIVVKEKDVLKLKNLVEKIIATLREKGRS